MNTTTRKIQDIPPPLYVNGQTREITINPSQQFQWDPLRRTLMRVELAALAYKYLKPYADYTLYIEYSEPHVNCTQEIKNFQFPRIHVHGVIRFHDVLGFLDIGFIGLASHSLFTINFHDPEYWNAYCTKWSSVWLNYPLFRPIITSNEKVPKADLKNLGLDSNRKQFAKGIKFLDTDPIDQLSDN